MILSHSVVQYGMCTLYSHDGYEMNRTSTSQTIKHRYLTISYALGANRENREKSQSECVEIYNYLIIRRIRSQTMSESGLVSIGQS